MNELLYLYVKKILPLNVPSSCINILPIISRHYSQEHSHLLNRCCEVGEHRQLFVNEKVAKHRRQASHMLGCFPSQEKSCLSGGFKPLVEASQVVRSQSQRNLKVFCCLVIWGSLFLSRVTGNGVILWMQLGDLISVGSSTKDDVGQLGHAKSQQKPSWWFQPIWKILVKIGIFP